MHCGHSPVQRGRVRRPWRVSFLAGIGHGLFTFLRVYVLRGGFLDGAEGFLLAVANAEGSYYRYMKAWLATRERKISPRREAGEGDRAKQD